MWGLYTPRHSPTSSLPVTASALRPVTTGLSGRKGAQRISMYLKIKLVEFKFYVLSYVNQLIPHCIFCLKN